MTRHKEHECEIDEAALLKGMAYLAELKADPEHQRKYAKEVQEIAEYMATLDCECPFDHCNGRVDVPCQSWDSKAGFLHVRRCASFKAWMTDFGWFKDGAQMRAATAVTRWCKSTHGDTARPYALPACLN